MEFCLFLKINFLLLKNNLALDEKTAFNLRLKIILFKFLRVFEIKKTPK